MRPLYEMINEYLAGRVKTRIYGIFLMWMFIFHIHIIFTALFVDQDLIFEKYSMLKGEYIRQNYIQLDTVWFWAYEISVLLLSLILTWLMIWVLPKTLLRSAYSRESTDEYGRRGEKLKKQLELQKIKDDIAQSRLDEASKEEAAIDKKENIADKETDEWDRDYEKFSDTGIYNQFSEIITAIAEYNGLTLSRNFSGAIEFQMSKGLKTYAYVNNLLEFTDNEKNAFDLTTKGKYFIKLYQQENS